MIQRIIRAGNGYIATAITVAVSFGLTYWGLAHVRPNATLESAAQVVVTETATPSTGARGRQMDSSAAALAPFAPAIASELLPEIPIYPAALRIDSDPGNEGQPTIQLCQYEEPILGVPPGTWDHWEQGNYTGPARNVHVNQYRLRVDDQLEFFFRLTREISNRPYELNPGDEIDVDFTNDKAKALELSRTVTVQPSGQITLKLVGNVSAAGLTLEHLQQKLEKRYEAYIEIPGITVSPKKLDTKLEELRNVFDRRAGIGGQSLADRVSPEGTIQLPGIKSVFVHGLTLSEVDREIDARYAMLVDGVEITTKLTDRAPTSIFVLGEVATPGQYQLAQPTSVMDAVALANGWNPGGNLRHIIVFRRTDDWGIIATRVDIHDALYGNDAIPRDNIWLRHLDTVIVPKRNVQVMGDWINLIFTRGLYSVIPLQYTVTFLKTSTI